MHNIVDLFSTLLQGFLLLLGRGIGAYKVKKKTKGSKIGPNAVEEKINQPISMSAPFLTWIS